MTALTFSEATNLSTDEQLAKIVAAITEQLQSGRPVDVENYVSRNPEQAQRLRRLVPAIQALVDIDLPIPGVSGACDRGNAATASARVAGGLVRWGGCVGGSRSGCAKRVAVNGFDCPVAIDFAELRESNRW